MSYYLAPFTFVFSISRIDVDVGTVDVDCMALYTAIKLAQASEEGIVYERIARGSGLESLGQGVAQGITVKLLGLWQLYFKPGNYIARVAGGNLVGGPENDPIAYTPGVQILLILSAASTVVVSGGSSLTPDERTKLMSLNTADVRTGLEVVNRGVQRSSLLIPHTEDLSPPAPP